jgi:hypothetical protein
MRENEQKMLRAEVDAVKEMVRAAGWSIDFAASLLGLDDPDRLMPNATWF